jgi:hypothetical protein
MNEIKDDLKPVLNKYFYIFYERYSNNKECGQLKPNKVFSTHQSIIAESGKGNQARTLFSIQK